MGARARLVFLDGVLAVEGGGVGFGWASPCFWVFFFCIFVCAVVLGKKQVCEKFLIFFFFFFFLRVFLLKILEKEKNKSQLFARKNEKTMEGRKEVTDDLPPPDAFDVGVSF